MKLLNRTYQVIVREIQCIHSVFEVEDLNHRMNKVGTVSKTSQGNEWFPGQQLIDPP